MCDDDIHVGLVQDPNVSRRTFGLMTVAAAGVASNAYAADVAEKDVEVKTPDGVCDAVLYHPTAKGTFPAVLIWTDILGLRPVFREMGKRLAAQGHVVLVPNPFYRSRRAPVVDGAFDFTKPEDRAKVFALRGAMTNDGIDKDAVAFVAFLDAQPQTNKKKKVGVQGYCMGGPLSFRTAAAVPTRIAAVGSFHGGGLTTKNPDSPHLLIPKTNAAYLVAVAQNDDKQQPDSKDILKAAFADAKKTATVEVYPAAHGWCVRGMTPYDEASAEKGWAELTKLYRAKLV